MYNLPARFFWTPLLLKNLSSSRVCYFFSFSFWCRRKSLRAKQLPLTAHNRSLSEEILGHKTKVAKLEDKLQMTLKQHEVRNEERKSGTVISLQTMKRRKEEEKKREKGRVVRAEKKPKMPA